MLIVSVVPKTYSNWPFVVYVIVENVQSVLLKTQCTSDKYTSGLRTYCRIDRPTHIRGQRGIWDLGIC